MSDHFIGTNKFPDLLERALFVFECSFHTLFNITLGECRLEYKRAENR